MNEKVFHVPIHNYSHVNHKVISYLITTSELQLSLRIKQVPTSAFTFHGAEHSRFSHCLGVYEIARQVISLFEQDNSDIWNAAESLLVMVAALLYDGGHSTYSLTFVRLFESDHERYTQDIFTSPDTLIYSFSLQGALDFPNKVASVIIHTYPNIQGVELISSQIYGDRMDDLRRDSYYTAAHYGQFALTRI